MSKNTSTNNIQYSNNLVKFLLGKSIRSFKFKKKQISIEYEYVSYHVIR